MALQFRQPELEQMKRIENEVARTLAPFRANTEAGLAIFALIRCARLLLRLYPERTQQELLSVVVPFLQGGPPPLGVDTDSESRVFLQ